MLRLCKDPSQDLQDLNATSAQNCPLERGDTVTKTTVLAVTQRRLVSYSHLPVAFEQVIRTAIKLQKATQSAENASPEQSTDQGGQREGNKGRSG